MAMLGDLGADRPFRRWVAQPGSRRPAIVTHFDLTLVVRAMFKIGVNLLAAYCHRTPVGRDRFARVIRLVVGEDDVGPGLVARNGFVEPAGVRDIARPGCHSFRVLHDGARWFVYSSFFGGRVGTRVDFEGPNCEDWKTLTVHAPIRSAAWTVEHSALYLPSRTRVVLSDSTKIVPSLQVQCVRTELTAGYVPRRRS